MKTAIDLASKMLLAVLMFPLALVHVWFLRTWVFYDVPDELKAMLAGATAEVRAFVAAQTKAHDEMADQVKELKTRTLDLEQRGVRSPIIGGAGDGDAGAIVKAISESEQFRLLQTGALKECRIPLPAGALQTKTILGPVSPGAAALQDPDRSSGIVGVAQRRMTVRGLLPSLPTSSGATQYARLLAFTNAAAPQGGTTSPDQATEGETKAESNMTFELVTSPIITLAHWVAASTQILSDMPALERFIDVWLRYGLALIEENNLLNGNGLQGTMQGLLSQASAFTGGGTNQTKLDTLRKAITQLQLAEHIATGILLNPTDWEGVELQKDTTGQYLNVVLNVNGTPIAWRVPVVATNSIAAGTFLVGDFESALVRDRQQATIEISNSHSDFFTRNLIAIRAELREGIEIHRPAGFVTGALDYAG